jgi:hypothetical protein
LAASEDAFFGLKALDSLKWKRRPVTDAAVEQTEPRTGAFPFHWKSAPANE